ncbi:MAG: DUF1934 family protein [Clostridia bacterium]|nr:DUF1934 family protein [Clostridia bacterium]
MSVCNVFFSVVLDGQSTSYQKQGNIDSKHGAHRVSFSLEKEGGLSYVFSVFKNKVTLSAVGDVSYTFTLRDGELFNFIINTVGAPIYCKVDCKALSIKDDGGALSISSRYVMDMGGNEAETELSLKVEVL